METDESQISELIDVLLRNNTFYFRNIIDVILFISRVNKNIKQEITNSDDKIATVRKIGKLTIDELEIRGLVKFELAYEIRTLLDNSKEYDSIFNGFLKFFI